MGWLEDLFSTAPPPGPWVDYSQPVAILFVTNSDGIELSCHVYWTGDSYVTAEGVDVTDQVVALHGASAMLGPEYLHQQEY